MARKPTAKMMAYEERFGRPVADVVIEGLLRHGSILTLARELDVPDATIRRWMLTFHIEMEVLSTIRVKRLTPTGMIYHDHLVPRTDGRSKGEVVDRDTVLAAAS